MKDKINIAKLLKDCPKGMELDCTMYENVTFEEVVGTIDCDGNEEINIILLTHYNDGTDDAITLTNYGTYTYNETAKCVIFPKGKTTWEGFVPPCKFKEGDVVTSVFQGAVQGTGIFDYEEQSEAWIHVCINLNNEFSTDGYLGHVYNLRLATEEEKEKLFKAIKDNGYKWNPKTKTLKELVKPKFKVGDRIKQIGSPRSYIIKTIEFDRYVLNNNQFVRFRDEHIYELVPSKFDINTLIPFESRVLMRDKNTEKWVAQFFSHYNNGSDRPYTCIGCEGLNEYKQCIPYEGNEHLLDTTNDCDEYYKTW